MARVLLWLSVCLSLRMGGAMILPPAVMAHPGRLDAVGCHWVSRPWVSADGRTVLPTGDYHCHRPLGQLRFDQRERVQPDPNEGQGRELLMPHEDQERL